MSQFTATTYDVQRPTGRCAFTDQQLEPGTRYVATLVELTDEEREAAEQEAKQKNKPVNTLGMKRLDVSWDCWQRGKRPERLFSHWVTTVSEPGESKKLFVDDATLLNIVRRLEDDDDNQRVAFRHVVTLVLMRKKLLRYDAVEKDEQGRSWWVLTPKLDPSKGMLGKWHPDETLKVRDPGLDEDGVRQVTEQLGEILEADL